MHTKQCGLAVYNCLFTDTACILCDRVYVTIRCPSVCLSSFARCSACGGFAAVGPAVGRYRSTAAVAQQHGVQQQMRAMSCWDPRYEDQHRLTWFIINLFNVPGRAWIVTSVSDFSGRLGANTSSRRRQWPSSGAVRRSQLTDVPLLVVQTVGRECGWSTRYESRPQSLLASTKPQRCSRHSESSRETYCVRPHATSLAATGTHVPYGITECYLPSGRGDIPALTQPRLVPI